jgi:hypothetical protein
LFQDLHPALRGLVGSRAANWPATLTTQPASRFFLSFHRRLRRRAAAPPRRRARIAIMS